MEGPEEATLVQAVVTPHGSALCPSRAFLWHSPSGWVWGDHPELGHGLWDLGWCCSPGLALPLGHPPTLEGSLQVSVTT